MSIREIGVERRVIYQRAAYSLTGSPPVSLEPPALVTRDKHVALSEPRAQASGLGITTITAHCSMRLMLQLQPQNAKHKS